MRVIIAGSRPPKIVRENSGALQQWYKDHQHLVHEAVEASGFNIDQVVCGKAAGFDTLGERWAVRNGIPVQPFHAAWQLPDGSRNMAAGFERNEAMQEYAEGLIAIWNQTSNGTADMIRRMRRAGKPTYVHKYSDAA